MQVKRLLKEEPYSRSAVHAVTTPTVKALQQLRGKAYMGWITKAHDVGRDACTL